MIEKNFPYGINKVMDDHAKIHGLPHWSCVSPTSNNWWVRSDGRQCEPSFDGPKGYLSYLELFDKSFPLGT